MRNPSSLSLAAIAVLLLFSCAGQSQQQEVPLGQLREQIRQMEVIDRDPSTRYDVKELNRDFLKERRIQLATLLTRRLDALIKYKSTVGASLSPAENKLVDNSIQRFEEELQTLRKTQAISSSERSTNSAAETFQSPPKVIGLASDEKIDSKTAAMRPIAEEAEATSTRGVQAGESSDRDCYAEPPPEVVGTAESIAKDIVTGGFTPRVAVSRHFNSLMYFAVADAILPDTIKSTDRANLLRLEVQQFALESSRTDKQTGASARTEGSTSAVEKPGFANLLAFAIEHGAAQQAVNGTTLTLSTSPYALLAAANGGDTSNNHRKYEFFNRVGVAASFNLNGQTEDNVLASATRKQLAEWSVRLRLSGDHSSRSPAFQTFWDNNIKPLQERRGTTLDSGVSNAFSSELTDLYEAVKTKLIATLPEGGKTEDIKQKILCLLRSDVFAAIRSGKIPVSQSLRDDVGKKVGELADVQSRVAKGRQALLKEIKRLNNKPSTTLEYANEHPATMPVYSVFKFLHERTSFSPMKLIGNAAVSLYQKPDRKMNQNTLRDFAVALSFEGNAAKSPFVSTEFDQSQITFSFTGRYQRMFENRHQRGRKADIALAQFKLEIPVFTGVSLPFSITYANATELIKERHVRANFGFSLDTDKLFAFTKTKK